MKRKKPSKSSPSFDNPEIEQIEQLFQFMTEHNLEEFEYSRGDLRIRLRKPSAGVGVLALRNLNPAEIFVFAWGAPQSAARGGVPPPGGGATPGFPLVQTPTFA